MEGNKKDRRQLNRNNELKKYKKERQIKKKGGSLRNIRKIELDEEMINIITLYFTKEFLSENEPSQLLLGDGIGIVIVVL